MAEMPAHTRDYDKIGAGRTSEEILKIVLRAQEADRETCLIEGVLQERETARRSIVSDPAEHN
ncbi:hypothetical protein AB0D38_09625 [Streptomyces sp. NPDC048279]|uniref:hypothetical protein n=1 Tax=Streptomyces sp. NPDC048279 TaxID=3154714 RepID=UPI003426770C